ncbi:hypothetical protein [Streptomyces sp. NPDC053367]|uniref:hypothetical protein n=1 Tax=Streptomyces sp. NPDC053367 TaxID=3365700 RepID=UPI0037D6996B
MTSTPAPGGAAAWEGNTMRGPRPIRRHTAAFLRFAALGSGVTLAASAALVQLAQWMPWMAANALTTVASSVLATELHARVSFGHGRPGPAGHLKSGATVAAGWLVTSAAVGALAELRPDAGLVPQQTVYLTATALVGVGRYLVLRLAVFAQRPPRNQRNQRNQRTQRPRTGTDTDTYTDTGTGTGTATPTPTPTPTATGLRVDVRRPTKYQASA